MKKYFVRSLKYFCALCVLCVLIMLLNRLAGTSILTLKETFYVMFHTPKGMLLPVVIVVLAAVYPRIGFVTRRVEGDTEKDRQQIINAFRTAGFALRSEKEGVMIFRADSPLRKLTLLWEDEIRVSQFGQWIEIDGIRRGVARVQYQLENYLRNKRYDE